MDIQAIRSYFLFLKAVMSRGDLQNLLGISQTTFYKFALDLFAGETLPEGKAMRRLFELYSKETFNKDDIGA